MRHAVFLAGLAAGASASADMYKCLDASGHATYSNVQAKGCTRIVRSLPPAPAGAPVRQVVPGVKPGTPADFPRVDPATQRARDDGRRRILDTELAHEQRALDEARRLGAGDRIALHERNIEALRKEIGNLR